MSTSIEWAKNADGSAGETWNPIRAKNTATGQVGTHCVKVSPGCANCYAERHNWRNLPAGSSGLPYTQAGAAQVEYFIDPKMLAAPVRRKKAQTYFVCSMTDLFMYPPEMVAAVFGIMAACPQHTFQVLTKRPDRAAEFYAPNVTGFEGYEDDVKAHATASDVIWDGRGSDPLLYRNGPQTYRLKDRRPWHWPLPNVWLGVSVEDHKHGLPRIDILRQIPAALRFLSVEPLVEDLGELDLSGIDWVIVGGESGHGARPMHPAWVRSIRDQCGAAKVPFFFKQWGAWYPGATQGHPWAYVSAEGAVKGSCQARDEETKGWQIIRRVGKAKAGRLLDGREWSEMPERSNRAASNVMG